VRSLPIWLVGAALLADTAACKPPGGPERELSGERIYNRHCARCHGTDGRPTRDSPTARDLTNASYLDALSDDRIRMTVRGGKPPNMPAFGDQFMEPSLKVLVAYVRTLSKPAAPAGQPEDASQSDR
jgi:mono/diheme cytochrome c family protein